MSESSDERSPGFSNNRLTGKLIVVGLFVVVGTGVVAWSMNYCKKCAQLEVATNDSQVEGEEGGDEGGAASDSVPSLQLKGVSGSNAKEDSKRIASVSPTSSNRTSVANPANPTKKTSSSIGQFKPIVPKSENKGSGSFGLPESKTFNATPRADARQGATSNSFGGGFKTSQKQNALKAPVQENVVGGGQGNAVRQFNSNSNANQFGGNAARNLKQAATDLTDKASGTFKKIGDRAGNFAQNVKGAVQKNTQAAFTPAPGNTNPANARQSGLPPINSGGGAFDRSRELKPFASGNSPSGNQQNFAGNNGSTSSVKPPAAPTTNMRPNPSVSSSRQTGAGLTQLPRKNSIRSNLTNSSPIATPVNSARDQRTNLSSLAAGAITASTPGDRILEGIQTPSVTIEKIAPREVQVNQPADFQLVVKNVGRIVAKGVRVFDQIPSGTELVKSTPQPSRGPNNQISWDLDSLNPGQEKTIRLQLRPLTPGEIGSVAQVTFSAQASMRTKVTKPVLSIQHVTEPKVLVGGKVILDINVKNEGDGPAKDVVIQEDLPAGLEFNEGFRELEYAIGTLGPGQSRKLRLELRAAKIGKYRNVLVAHAGGGLQTQHALDLEVIAPALSATGEGPTRRFLKRKATHRFAVRNGGTAAATNVELVCRLPSGLRYIESNNRGKYDENSHSVYWSLAELGTGLVANVELTTEPTEPGNQDLKLDVVADLNQTTTAVCKLNVEHLVDVFFDIDDVVDPIEIGSETTYRLRVVNQGTKTATNVQLQVDFPQGIQPTGVEGNVTSNIRGQQIAFAPITSLNPGDTIEITLRGKGITAGDHRVSVNLMSDGREVNVSKQESTRVYSDR